MRREFEMSLMGEPNFFLGLQIKQEKQGIFINQGKCKGASEKFKMKNSKAITISMNTSTKLVKILVVRVLI